MIFLRTIPKMKVRLKQPQDAIMNLSSQARTHYFSKLEDRKDVSIVNTSDLQVPNGTVQGDSTYVHPELTLSSIDESAIIDFANSFFSNEETDLLIIERVVEDDLSNVSQ